jgi:formamidopyrimidine-DNA glycosylase
MPELPEAETIVRGLAQPLAGADLKRSEVLRPDVVKGEAGRFEAALTHRSIRSVGRRGKNIVLVVEPLRPGARPDRLVVNLGMTGGLLLAAAGDPPPTHPGVRFDLLDGRTLWYDDTRRFGLLEFMGPGRWREWNRTMGPEPLARSYTAARMGEELARSRSPIRSWLLDQRRVAGVGNIYASEALFGARIHPREPANRISAEGAASLHRSLRSVLRSAIRNRGTTLRDYRDAAGDEGGNAPTLRAYGREDQPCPRCRAPIRRIVFSNRSAFLCPRCQPAPR